MKTHPFSLDVIDVASPCKSSWDSMSGDERARFCGQCSKHVYNLSGMSREEAERLVNEMEVPMCVRFYRRADGTVLTADCPVGLWDVRTRLVRLWAGVAAMVGFLVFGAWSWATGSRNDEEVPIIESANDDGPVKTLRESLREPKVFVVGELCVPPVAPPPPVGPASTVGE